MGRAKTGGSSGTKVIERTERITKMLELRKAGHDLTYIANQFGCSAANISMHITRALQSAIKEAASEVIALELARLDTLFIKAYERATDEKRPFSRESIDACVRLMERRAKLLGLDKPTKVANTNIDGDKEAQQVQFYLPENNRDLKVDSQ